MCAAALCVAPATAYATDLEQLAAAYADAVQAYDEALDKQEANAQDIMVMEREIQSNQAASKRAQAEMGDAASDLYKASNHQSLLMDLIFGSDSYSEAMRRVDLYKKVEDYCVERFEQLRAKQIHLAVRNMGLAMKKKQVAVRVEEARQAAEEAERELLDASHSDGAQYHQRQGNGSNCGATSFIVAVNMLLHENRFPDNVAVWEGPGFNGDSTVDLAYKGRAWLLANGLGSEIAIEYVPGDIHTTEQLYNELNQGHVIVMSSGPDSIWQRANGEPAELGTFPDGHYAVFYRCEAGVFFCNDSSVEADRGAGIPYTEEQMQQWLDGRYNHHAVALYKK